MAVHASTRADISEVIEEDEPNTWMTVYADMMTLLLVFFIILFSMYYKDIEAFKASVSSLQISVDEDGETVSLIEFVDKAKSQQPVTLKPTTAMAQQTPNERPEIHDILNTQQWGDAIFQVKNGDKYVINFPGELLFESGKAELKPEAYVLLDPFDVIFEKFPDYHVRVRGHTDNVPIATPQFASNWELSAVRATTILRFFLDQGLDVNKASATGLADTVPVVSNDTPENRALNRRVEVVLEK
ncbi:MAG: OmpA family protein [Gammaproteobacteria bacterium]|nr:OmpA family protein [Gammaproteobacteria bacterium]